MLEQWHTLDQSVQSFRYPLGLIQTTWQGSALEQHSQLPVQAEMQKDIVGVRCCRGSHPASTGVPLLMNNSLSACNKKGNTHPNYLLPAKATHTLPSGPSGAFR